MKRTRERERESGISRPCYPLRPNEITHKMYMFIRHSTTKLFGTILYYNIYFRRRRSIGERALLPAALLLRTSCHNVDNVCGVVRGEGALFGASCSAHHTYYVWTFAGSGQWKYSNIRGRPREHANTDTRRCDGGLVPTMCLCMHVYNARVAHYTTSTTTDATAEWRDADEKVGVCLCANCFSAMFGVCLCVDGAHSPDGIRTETMNVYII